MTTTHRLTIPRIFWEDHHIGRCCSPDARVIRETMRQVVVELNNDDLDDLRSDADYYANDGLDFAGEKAAYRSLINSAKATLRTVNNHIQTLRS